MEKRVKLDTYEDFLKYNEENNEALSIPMSKTLMLDTSNIYRAFVIKDKNKIEKLSSDEKQKLYKLKNKPEAQLVHLIENGAATVYTQKLSMEQGEKKDDAYLPKKVETYEAYDLVKTLVSFMSGQEVYARIIGKSIYVVKPDFDHNRISMEKYDMKIKKDRSTGKVIDIKVIEKDKEFDEIKNADMKAFSIDTYGNLWVLSKGKIKKAINGKLETLYEVDRSMDKISVFDDNSMIAWNTDKKVYSVLNAALIPNESTLVQKKDENAASESENEVIFTEAIVQNGWTRNLNGSWSYKNLYGTNALGWIKDNNGKWYYLNSNGVMVTGWMKDGEDWYYLNESGDMKIGWFKDISGKWYYLNETGKMAYSTIVDGYRLDDNGSMIN